MGQSARLSVLTKHRPKGGVWYQRLIKPHSDDINAQNRELVLNWLLVGSLTLAAVALLNTLFSWRVLQDDYLLDRLPPILIFCIFFGGLLALSRKNRHHTVPSYILVLLIFTAGLAVVYQWSIINPVGILLFSLAIVMASILLGARYALYLAILVAAALSVLEIAKAHNLIRPDTHWKRQPSSLTDVVSFSAIYAVLALTSWLFNRQMERALGRAEQSEQDLKQERDLLEVKVEQRTRDLQAAQMEQVQQVYRFAELGHLSTALFHDLANHVMSVSLDIEGLQKRRRSDLLMRIQDNVRHIDDVVRRVQKQMRGNHSTESFNVVHEVQEIIKMLAYFSNRQGIAVRLDVPPHQPAIIFKGDLTRFRQIVINLLSNAMEAYPASRSKQARPVDISLRRRSGALVITVTDHGKGIPAAVQAKIFEPFFTTKGQGMGIGLFIVKKVVKDDFNGTIDVTSSPEAGTRFVVKLKLKKDGRAKP